MYTFVRDRVYAVHRDRLIYNTSRKLHLPYYNNTRNITSINVRDTGLLH